MLDCLGVDGRAASTTSRVQLVDLVVLVQYQFHKHVHGQQSLGYPQHWVQREESTAPIDRFGDIIDRIAWFSAEWHTPILLPQKGSVEPAVLCLTREADVCRSVEQARSQERCGKACFPFRKEFWRPATDVPLKQGLI